MPRHITFTCGQLGIKLRMCLTVQLLPLQSTIGMSLIRVMESREQKSAHTVPKQ